MYEYKVVPAPARTARIKGLKTPAERFAHMLSAAINAEANGGWQFLRTETLACEERTLTGRMRNSTQTVMIFARELAGASAEPEAPASVESQAPWPPAPQSEAEAYEPQAENDTWPQDEAAQSWDDGAQEQAEPEPAPASARATAPAAPRTRQEPLFRSGALLRGDGAPRAEPRLRPQTSDDDDT